MQGHHHRLDPNYVAVWNNKDNARKGLGATWWQKAAFVSAKDLGYQVTKISAAEPPEKK